MKEGEKRARSERELPGMQRYLQESSVRCVRTHRPAIACLTFPDAPKATRVFGRSAPASRAGRGVSSHAVGPRGGRERAMPRFANGCCNRHDSARSHFRPGYGDRLEAHEKRPLRRHAHNPGGPGIDPKHSRGRFSSASTASSTRSSRTRTCRTSWRATAYPRRAARPSIRRAHRAGHRHLAPGAQESGRKGRVETGAPWLRESKTTR